MKNKRNIDNELSRRYLLAREHLRITQIEMANEMGVSPAVISKIENDSVKKFNPNYTKHLIKVHGINPLYLSGESEDMFAKQIEVNSSEIADLQKEIAALKLALSETKEVLKKTDVENERNKKNLDVFHELLARERHEAGEMLYHAHAELEQLKEKNAELEKTICELERSAYLKDHFTTPNETSIIYDNNFDSEKDCQFQKGDEEILPFPPSIPDMPADLKIDLQNTLNENGINMSDDDDEEPKAPDSPESEVFKYGVSLTQNVYKQQKNNRKLVKNFAMLGVVYILAKTAFYSQN